MARRRPATLHGLLVVDKPAGITSHDVVYKVRKALGEKRVGHSGTLDPDATGVLVLGVGNATRLMRYIDVVREPSGASTTSKAYTCDVILGSETNTLDASGEITASYDMVETVADINTPTGRARLEAVIAANLVGDIMQVPPMVSALSVDGRRLHELAREGVEVEREPRPVTVHEFKVVNVDGPVIHVQVRCSSGTYVRSLGESLGHLLGGGAHIANLRRTEVGAFTLDDCISVDQVSADQLRPLTDCVRGLEQVAVDDDTARRIRVGQVLPESLFGVSTPPWAAIGSDGQLLAVYEPHDRHVVRGADGSTQIQTHMARPQVVIPATESGPDEK